MEGVQRTMVSGNPEHHAIPTNSYNVPEHVRNTRRNTRGNNNELIRNQNTMVVNNNLIRSVSEYDNATSRELSEVPHAQKRFGGIT